MMKMLSRTSLTHRKWRKPYKAFILIMGICLVLGILPPSIYQHIKQYSKVSSPWPSNKLTTAIDKPLQVTTPRTVGTLNVTVPTQSPIIIQSYLKLQKELCEKEWSTKAPLMNASSEWPLCDCVPDTLLLPSLNIKLNPVPLEETAKNNLNVHPGGHWEPNNCTARYRVVIVIPFRDRHSHLSTLLHYLHPMLQGQQINYTIVVVEQHLPKIFNKAVMMNIGYHYAVMKHNPDCVIFHDVDFIPEDGRHLYRCRDKPVHLGAFHDHHEYKLIRHGFIFGGVTVFTPAQFQRVNGFSNRYFGWGGEDDDMWGRIRVSKLGVIRDPREVGGYRVIEHKRDRGNVRNGAMWKRLRQRRQRNKDGLNTLQYVTQDVQLYPLYTWLLVDVGPVRLWNSFFIEYSDDAVNTGGLAGV